MRVYLIMSEEDAHVDPVRAVFATAEKAEEYIKSINEDYINETGFDLDTDGNPEYIFEAVSIEVR